MASSRISDREQALIDAARREVAGRHAPAAAGRAGGNAAVAVPPAALTPLDQPTVFGWDHPEAAQAAPKVKIADPGQDKWARVAALMETERRAENARRVRTRQRAMYVMLAMALALLALVLLTLRR